MYSKQPHVPPAAAVWTVGEYKQDHQIDAAADVALIARVFFFVSRANDHTSRTGHQPVSQSGSQSPPTLWRSRPKTRGCWLFRHLMTGGHSGYGYGRPEIRPP